MTADLDRAALRAVAEAATPGGTWVAYSGDSFVFAGDDGEDVVADAEDGTAAHIATFDPPTILALLDVTDRLEADLAEAQARLAAVRAAVTRIESQHGAYPNGFCYTVPILKTVDDLRAALGGSDAGEGA